MYETLSRPSKSGEAEKSEFLRFFKEMEARRDPGYVGYERVAQSFMAKLDLAAERARSNDTSEKERLIDLELRPGSGAETLYFTDHKAAAGTDALISKAYRMTGADNNIISQNVMHPATDNEPEHSETIRRGFYKGGGIYFIELRNHGIVEIKLAAGIPEDFLPNTESAGPKPTLSHGERIKIWNNYFDSHKGPIPANLTEEEVIEQAVKNRRK